VPISISFESNNLTDIGVNTICDFCSENEYLRRNLKKIDLSNNEFTKGSFSKIRDLITCCPNLTIDISCNSNTRDVRKDLGGFIDAGRIVYTGAW